MKPVKHLRYLSLRSSVLMGAATLFAAQNAAAISTAECFDFNDVAVGTSFNVGSVPLQSTLGEVRVQAFIRDGQLIDPASGSAVVTDSGLPTGTAPSLELLNASIQVRLNTPVTAVSVDFAQNTGLDDQRWQNLGVNGDRRTELTGGFEQLDRERIGLSDFGGEADIVVFTDPDADTLPTFERGHLRVSAIGQGINVFDIGAQSRMLLDNFCLYMN